VEHDCSNLDCAKMTGSDDIEMGFWVNKVFRLQCIEEIKFFISLVVGRFFRSKKKKEAKVVYHRRALMLCTWVN